jgi:hypothetical protein
MMRRRAFIAGLGSAAAWPIAVRAQQAEPTRRIGILSNAPAEAQGDKGVEALQEALQQLGWTNSRNLRIDVRWAANDIDRDRKYAAELIALGQMSSLLSAHSESSHCRGQRTLCRSCLCGSPIRWAPVSLNPWPGPAATRQAS